MEHDRVFPSNHPTVLSIHCTIQCHFSSREGRTRDRSGRFLSRRWSPNSPSHFHSFATIMESDPKEPTVAEEVNEEEYDDEDYTEDEDTETIDVNDDDYVVVDVDDFIEKVEAEIAEEEAQKKEGIAGDAGDAEEAEEAEDAEEPETIQRDSFHSFEEHTDSVLCVAFNPSKNSQVLTGGQDNRAFLFDYNHPEQKRELAGHTDSVCAIAFNTAGDLCATGDMNGLIQVWRTANGKLVASLQGPEELEWLKFHPRGNMLLASGNDYSVWTWMVPAADSLTVRAAAVREALILSGHTDIVTSAAVAPSGKLLVTGSLDNTLKMWQLRSHELLYSVKSEENNWHEGGLECLDLFATNSLAVSGARDGSVKLTNLKTHKVLAGYKHSSSNEDENCSVEDVAFNPVFHWVASASMNSTVIVYDYQTSCVRHELKHDGGVIKLAWHPNGIVLVTGCLDGCVYLWNGRDGSLIHKMNGHTDMLLDMDVIVKGKKTYIATVGDDKTCQVYRVDF